MISATPPIMVMRAIVAVTLVPVTGSTVNGQNGRIADAWKDIAHNLVRAQ
jgi:signal transduction histidine kinase